MAMPDTRDEVQEIDFAPLSRTPGQFAELTNKKEMVRYGKAIR